MIPTGLLVAFIILGVVLIAGIALWIVFGVKAKKQRKEKILKEQESKQENNDVDINKLGGF